MLMSFSYFLRSRGRASSEDIFQGCMCSGWHLFTSEENSTMQKLIEHLKVGGRYISLLATHMHAGTIYTRCTDNMTCI